MPSKDRILVINSGSSTIKFRIYAATESAANSPLELIAKGSVSKLGSGSAPIEVKILADDGRGKARTVSDSVTGETTHDDAIKKIVEVLEDKTGLLEGVKAVGHRVVHGGTKFRSPLHLTKESLSDLEALSALAPLHNHASVLVVRTCLELLPDAIQIAVFDTCFHRTLPEKAYTYPLPYEACVESGLRRFGFHGTSIEGRTPAVKSAPKGPQITKAEDILNHESGLRGVCGESDVQKVLDMAAKEQGEKQQRAKLALDMFCYRIQKYVGAYFAVLNGADALVFTGGIGENAWEIRQWVCDGLSCLGIAVDHGKNQAAKAGDEPVEISGKGAKVRVFVVATDEEGEIAKIVITKVREGMHK
ncbi:hypothetical protein HK104_010281 [Borealophlyctis nickersoniae]|nr:hypothetical protein HK104_010281 [Borealophlyctis nickersoniae]